MLRTEAKRWVRGISLPVAFMMLLMNTAIPVAVQAAAVKIQMGTPVELVFDQTVSGETATVGQQVTLRVASAVMVDGKTVIAAGAPASGEIMVARKSGMVGSAGMLTVVAKSVTAVDGTVIALSGTKAMEGKSNVTTSVIITVLCCVLGLLMKGEKADIPSGATLRATAATAVDVNVE